MSTLSLRLPKSFHERARTAYNQIGYSGAYAAVMLRYVGEQLERNRARLMLFEGEQ
jgi:hypothetical protein